MGNRRLLAAVAGAALVALGVAIGILVGRSGHGGPRAISATGPATTPQTAATQPATTQPATTSATTTAPPVPDPSSFVADFEVGPPGWQQFTGLQYEEDRPLADSFALVHDPVREGKSAARFTAQQGYSRFGANEDTEVVWHSGEREGDDDWYAWSTLFPTDWQPPYHWGIFAQWHAPLGTSPIIAFNARDDTASVDVHSGLTDPVRNSFAHDLEYPLLTTLSKGQWNDFVMHVHWTRSSDGLIQIYHRLAGQRTLHLLVSVTHIPTFQFTSDGSGIGTYSLLGIYRGSYCAQPTTLNCTSSQGVQPPTVIYQDQFARARSFAQVAALAFPDSPPSLAKS